MKNKKAIYFITVLACLLILSIVFFILVQNNNLLSDPDREATVLGDSLLIAAESDIEEASESINDINEDTYNESITVDASEDISLDVADEIDESSLNQADISDSDTIDIVDEEEIIPVDTYDTITISAAGDVTLGRDEKFGWERTFDHELELQKGDYGYFFRNVKDIFEADDLTIVNLETTLTTATKKAEKKFRFKADPSYVEILKQGNIEAVSIANNHTLDFLDKGYKDTLETLDEAGGGYFGYEHKYITQVRDTKIGLLGYYTMKVTDKLKDEIKQAIEELKNEGTDLVIIMFHWGIERDYWPNSVQKKLAYFSIDSGADLVLGCHPHVLQGIEDYKGKQIVYSLANFCFGGNKNPDDKDTMIYVQRFNFKNGELISQEYDIIPCSISSVSNRNNYQPTPLEGKEADRVMKKIKKYSDF
ncbi:MAG: CapA family protein [Clostridiales bacterium]|nr:CapA family protein [Clostridiales bacterium]